MITPAAGRLRTAKSGSGTIRSAGCGETLLRRKPRIHPPHRRRLARHPVPGDPAELSVPTKVTGPVKAPVVSVGATIIVSSGAQVGPLAVPPEGIATGLHARRPANHHATARLLVVRSLDWPPHQAGPLTKLGGPAHLSLPKLLAFPLDALPFKALLLALETQEFQTLPLELFALHAEALTFTLNAEGLLTLPALKLPLAERRGFVHVATERLPVPEVGAHAAAEWSPEEGPPDKRTPEASDRPEAPDEWAAEETAAPETLA